MGKGIDSELLPHIFEGRQYTSGSSDGRRGIGIGLSICKTIIQAHGGEITAVNHDKGAEFVFTLPKEKERTKIMSNCSVLIIETKKRYRSLWEKF